MKKLLFLLISINIFAKDVILLLGSMNNPNAKYMDKIVKALSKEGIEIIDDIGVDSFIYTITEQADIVYQALRNKEINKEDRIVIIGHSQGGLKGYELYRKHKNDLNILALFTISTPWKGAGILEKIKDVYNRLVDIPTIFSKTGSDYDTLRDKTCKEMNLSLQDLKNLLALFPSFDKSLKDLENSPGAKDLKVDSTFIKSLNQESNLSNLNVSNNNVVSEIALPIFNIIGHKVNLDNYLPNEELIKVGHEIDQGLNSLDNLVYVGAGSAVGGMFLSAAFASLMGPFALILAGLGVGGWIAAGNVAENRSKGLIEVRGDLTYLKDCINYISYLASKNKNKDDHDFILSVYEQSLPDYLEKLQESINFLKPYSERKIFIEEGIHGEINIEGINIEKLNSLNSKATYNQDKAIKFIKENIEMILKKEEK